MPHVIPAVTRIRTGVAAATTQSTNHYTITATGCIQHLLVVLSASLSCGR